MYASIGALFVRDHSRPRTSPQGGAGEKPSTRDSGLSHKQCSGYPLAVGLLQLLIGLNEQPTNLG